MADCITESYCENGVAHWKPDLKVGAEMYYGLDWTKWATAEGDTIDSVTWDVPTGLTNMAEALNGNKASVKLRADTVGSYVVTCTVQSSEGALTQKSIKEVTIEVVN